MFDRADPVTFRTTAVDIMAPLALMGNSYLRPIAKIGGMYGTHLACRYIDKTFDDVDFSDGFLSGMISIVAPKIRDQVKR